MTQAAASAGSGLSKPPPAGRSPVLVLVPGALTAVAPLSIDKYLPALPRMSADLSTGAARTQLTAAAGRAPRVAAPR